jgi:LL-diaminopimelate aminotransferase
MRNFPEYVFSKLAREVSDVETKSGRKVLNLCPGSPDFPPSIRCLDKLAELIHEPKSYLYPGYGAVPEFSEALANWYKKRFGVSLEKDELLPLLGAKDGVVHIPMALTEPGEEILIPDPGYPAYVGSVILAGGKAVFYNSDLEEVISGKTKCVWVNYPANPTGKTVTLKELKKIVDTCKKYGLFLLYDNAYSEITFDGYTAPSILQISGAKEVAVELGSFSKTFSFAGLRMGWVVGNRKMISKLMILKSQIDSGMATPLQKLGAFALNNYDIDWHREMISSYQKRREIIANKLTKLGLQFVLPKGGLYIWAKIPDNFISSESFCHKLLWEKQILVTPGSAFGSLGSRYVRVSICSNIGKIDEYL